MRIRENFVSRMDRERGGEGKKGGLLCEDLCERSCGEKEVDSKLTV